MGLDTGNDKHVVTRVIFAVHGIAKKQQSTILLLCYPSISVIVKKVLNTIAESMANRTEVHYEFRINHPKLGER
jgi:hypothetical protein